MAEGRGSSGAEFVGRGAVWFVGGEQGVLHESRTSAAAPGGVPVDEMVKFVSVRWRWSMAEQRERREERKGGGTATDWSSTSYGTAARREAPWAAEAPGLRLRPPGGVPVSGEGA